MTVGARTDILPLMYDQRMGTPERRFRATWHKAGARFAPLKPDTKKRAWKGTHYSQQLLGGDAHMTVPPGHVLIDPDSDIAQQLLLELELPPTLTLGARRGNRLLYRLPPGVLLRQHIGLLTDLDVITTHFVAPGSVVDGTYYSVVADRPVAELPIEIALGLQLLAQPRLAETGLNFRVHDVMAHVRAVAAENRRVKARAARGRSIRRLHSGGSLAADPAQRWQEWLAEARDGHRHQALWSLALSMNRLGYGYDYYEKLVAAHPVSSKLHGQSPRWLREQVWDKAVAWLASHSSAPSSTGHAASGPRWVRRWRQNVAAPAARKWLQHVELVLNCADLEPAMRQSLLELCELHAVYAVDFGIYGSINQLDQGRPCYFLAFSLMRKHLGGVGGDAVNRRLKRLVGLGVLVQMDRTGLIQDQATYYQLKINRRLGMPAPPGSTSLSCHLTCGFASGPGRWTPEGTGSGAAGVRRAPGAATEAVPDVQAGPAPP